MKQMMVSENTSSLLNYAAASFKPGNILASGLGRFWKEGGIDVPQYCRRAFESSKIPGLLIYIIP